MRFKFKDPNLETLYTQGFDAPLARAFPEAAIKGFFKVMGVIDRALDERDFKELRGLGYHPLERDRDGQHAFKLNTQWRLAVEWQKEQDGSWLLIVEIVDYH